MVKKIGSTFMAVVLLFSVLALSGCNLFKKKVEVSIVYLDETVTKTLVLESSNSVEKRYVDGKVLLGFYDTKDDSGTKYFDYLGNSVKHFDTFPENIYAVYEDFNYDYKIYSSTQHTDVSRSVSGYPGSSTKKVAGWNNLNTVNDDKYQYLSAVLAQYPDLMVNVSIEFEVKSDTGESVVCNVTLGNTTLVKQEFSTSSSSYQKYSLSKNLLLSRIFGSNARDEIWLNAYYDATVTTSRPFMYCYFMNCKSITSFKQK